jgi:plasmid stability protein
MRTTILLDDRLGERLRARARQEGKSFSAFLADAGRKALESHEEVVAEPFQLITYRGDAPWEGIDLDRTSELLVADDLATYGERPS